MFLSSLHPSISLYFLTSSTFLPFLTRYIFISFATVFMFVYFFFSSRILFITHIYCFSLWYTTSQIMNSRKGQYLPPHLGTRLCIQSTGHISARYSVRPSKSQVGQVICSSQINDSWSIFLTEVSNQWLAELHLGRSVMYSDRTCVGGGAGFTNFGR